MSGVGRDRGRGRRPSGERRFGLVVLAAPAVLALVAVAVALTVGRGGEEEAARVAELRPERPGGPLGLAVDDGERVRMVVWGLEPGSVHLVQRGVGCEPSDDREGSVEPAGRIAADATGVAFTRVTPGRDDRPAVLVRSAASARSARVSCGVLGASGRSALIGRIELAGAGPGSAAAVGSAALVQLRRGLPEGGVRVLRVRPGEPVALAVRSDRPGEVALESSALRWQVGPGLIARARFAAPAETGRRRLLGPDGATALVLDVRR